MIAASTSTPPLAPSTEPRRVRIWFRDAVPTDLPYVAHSWRESWRLADRCHAMRGRDYRRLFDDMVRGGLMTLDDTRITVGCDPSAPDRIWCWAAHTPGLIPTLHYAVTRRHADQSPMRRIGLFTRLVAAIGVRDAVVYTFRPASRSHRHDKRGTGIEGSLLEAAQRAGIVARYHAIEEFMHHRRGGTL